MKGLEIHLCTCVNGPIHAAQDALTGTNIHVPMQDREACLERQELRTLPPGYEQSTSTWGQTHSVGVWRSPRTHGP